MIDPGICYASNRPVVHSVRDLEPKAGLGLYESSTDYADDTTHGIPRSVRVLPSPGVLGVRVAGS